MSTRVFSNEPKYFGDHDADDDTSEGYGVLRDEDMSPKELMARRAAQQAEWLKKTSARHGSDVERAEAEQEIITTYLAKFNGPPAAAAATAAFTPVVTRASTVNYWEMSDEVFA